MNRAIFSALLAIFVWTPMALAQLTTGTISGVAKDESGAVVPGVAVTVKNQDTGIVREVATDAQGRYRAPNLSLGNYEVQAALSGFQTAVRTGITLLVGQEALIDFTLKVGEVTAKVEVTGEAPLVEATRSDVSGVIEQKQVEELPLNGRSYLQLAQLQTGVVAARNSARTSPGLQQAVFAVGGSQATSGLFLLDGTDIVDYLYATAPGGSSGLAIGVDMIREFRVLTNSFSAEYGRSAGGVMSVVSRGGTNQLQGTAFWFHRNDNLDARDFFATKKPEFRRNQWGATVGGPIIRDKTFFLGSYEGLREGLGLSSVAIVPNARAREGFVPIAGGGETNVGVAANVKRHLDLYPLPNTGKDYGNGTGEFRGSATRVAHDDALSVRVDHVLSEKDTLFGRYTFRDGKLDDPFGSTPVPGFTSFGINRNHFLTLQEMRVFSPTVINTFRAGLARFLPSSTAEIVPPELSISLLPNRNLSQITIGSLNNLGHRASRPSFAATTTYQFQDAVDFTRGGHSVKVGAEIVRYHINFKYENVFGGTYSFSNLTSFLRGTPTSYTGVLPGSDGYRGWRWSTYGFFVQDEWRMFPHFTLNLGLRYEPYGNVSEVNGKLATLLEPLKDTKMTVVPTMFGNNPGTKLFQPRFGFAWDPFRNGKLAIRGGFGVFYDRVHANSYNGQNTNVPFATTIQITNPPFPRALAPGQTFTPTSVSVGTIMSYNDFKYPYTMQWNFTVQQEIVPSTVVSATYAASRGVHVLMQGQLDLNKWEMRDGRKFFPRTGDRLNPAFASIVGKLPQGNSFYHSLQLNLRRRMTAGLQFQAAYTWSKAMDDGTTYGTAPVGNSAADVPDVFDTKLSRGLQDLDVRHNFVFNSTYQLPFAKGNKWLGGWQLGGIVSLASGIPFSQYVGFERSRSIDRGGNSSAPDRVREVKTESRNVERYFDLNAFVLPPAGFFGNAGRNSVIGPGFAGVDFSVMKNFPITERVKVQWRAETFNLFNRASFASPGDTGAGSLLGLILFTDASGIPVPTGGKILRTVSAGRQIQMGLKISF